MPRKRNVKQQEADENVETVETLEKEKVYAYKVFSKETVEKSFGRNKRIVEQLVSNSVRGKLKRVYNEGKKTEIPSELFENHYGICIFLNLEDAIEFHCYSRFREIWKVEIGQVIEPAERRFHVGQLPKLFPNGKNKDSYRKVLTVLKKKLMECSIVNSWPKGTKMTDWVIPVEKVS